MSRTSYVVCRLSPTSPAGCVYFTGAIEILPADGDRNAAAIGAAFEPDDVLTFNDEHAAARVALWLNVIGGEQEPGAGLWQALPYIIRAGRAA